MTIRTVTPDELEALAFDSGQPIHLGRHEADLTIGDTMFVARLEPVA